MRSVVTHPQSRQSQRPAAGLLRGLTRGNEGAAAVEFAIVAPILLAVIFMIVDFGRALWTYNVAISALREGGRAAAVAGLTGTTCSGNAAIVTSGQTRATAYLQGMFGSSLNLPGVTVTCTNGIISVGYASDAFPFEPVAPLLSKLTGTSITVRPAVFRWEKES
jgi:Flp pilus assembly protein TadG